MRRCRQLFVMISQTDTGIAQLVQSFCRYPYNHVSLTLDPSLRQWYSFARYVQDAPFFSGFIREPVERFLAKNGDANVRIFCLEIPENRALQLEQLFTKAGQPDGELIYNLFDAIASGFGGSMQLPNSHTCLSFACSVLGRHHRSIKALNDDLLPFLIYEGSLAALVPDSGSREDLYFTRLGLLHSTAYSLRQLGILSFRLLRHGFDGYMARRFHRSVH